MKKIIIFIILISLFSCSTPKKCDLFLGSSMDNYVTLLKENDSSINNNFTMQKGYISYLYSMLSNDSKDLLTNKKISSLIKNARKIYIQIGNMDFLRCITYKDNQYVVNDETLINQKELFSYYYFLILEEICFLFEGDIVLLSPYLNIKITNNLSIIDAALNEFFEVVNEVSEYFGCEYIDIRQVNLFLNEDGVISQEGYSYLNRTIFYGN